MNLFFWRCGTADDYPGVCTRQRRDAVRYGQMNMSPNSAFSRNRIALLGFSSSSTPQVGSVTAPQSGTPAPSYNGTSATATANPYAPGPITALTSAADGARRSFTFTPPVPAAPTNLTFTNVFATGMTLNWTDVATNERRYAIYFTNLEPLRSVGLFIRTDHGQQLRAKPDTIISGK